MPKVRYKLSGSEKANLRIPDFSNSMRCLNCGQPIGRRGDPPAVAVRKPDGSKGYIHQGKRCRS